jgi:hypothetical protein
MSLKRHGQPEKSQGVQDIFWEKLTLGNHLYIRYTLGRPLLHPSTVEQWSPVVASGGQAQLGDEPVLSKGFAVLCRRLPRRNSRNPPDGAAEGFGLISDLPDMVGSVGERPVEASTTERAGPRFWAGCVRSEAQRGLRVTNAVLQLDSEPACTAVWMTGSEANSRFPFRQGFSPSRFTKSVYRDRRVPAMWAIITAIALLPAPKVCPLSASPSWRGASIPTA